MEKKQQESKSTKAFIVAGNTGLGCLVFVGGALYFGLRNGRFFTTYMWIAIALAIAAFIGFVVSFILAFVFKSKENVKKPVKPQIAGENKKREVFVVAGAIIKDGYVFAAQRGNKGETKFKWEFPGGKIEPGETPQEALARELQEELKIKVKVYERITNIVDEYPTQILHIDTYRCELLEGTPTLTEHINMAWSNKDELDQLEFSPADAPTLDKIKKIYL